MTVQELITELMKIEDQDRSVQILIGDEDNDSLGCEIFSLMHTDDSPQCVEIFCDVNDCYTNEVFPETRISITKNSNNG